MTAPHGACIGPPNATNVHRDCPRTWVDWRGVERVCGCSVAGCACAAANEERENSA